MTAACVKRAVVEAGKFFSTSNKPASAADVDPESLESNPANVENDDASQEEEWWAETDIDAAIAALQQLRAEGSPTATRDTLSDGSTTIEPIETQTSEPTTDTVSCHVYFVVLANILLTCCCFCLLQTTDPCLYLGDFWFGLVRYACAVSKAGNHCVMHVKTAHARFPKKFLEDEMKTMLGGCWIVL